ncbi:hypothetical protein SAMN05878281_3268 [Salegentibacter salegens]|uniref:Uncharacterized protein n=1 Tax=Salegentibacter salegens TaxID=143223 RepID=A0A1M7NLJ9_9FLAO|nr:hypothetical protein LY58_03382 [Salegentibacter salegens]SHN04864.1 hypothetical protein SAMN05878281_3268 [Salegentibacter salegens]
MQCGLNSKSWYFALKKKVVAVKAGTTSNRKERIGKEREVELH